MSDDAKVGTLWLIATPIGNLGDVSSRTKETLSSLDLLACESTAAARRLCSALSIPCPRLVLYREDSGEGVQERILSELRAGKHCGLVSDAGTPGLSDPGWKLVAACHREGLRILGIPGPSALTTALSVAGLPTRRFVFEGFPPHKRAERMTFLRELSRNQATTVFFESPHNILETLKALTEFCGPTRRLSISRELTKLHETNTNRPLEEWMAAPPPARGEFVLLLEGAPPTNDAPNTAKIQEQVDFLRRCQLNSSQIKEFLTNFTGLSRNQAYRLTLEKISPDRD